MFMDEIIREVLVSRDPENIHSGRDSCVRTFIVSCPSRKFRCSISRPALGYLLSLFIYWESVEFRPLYILSKSGHF